MSFYETALPQRVYVKKTNFTCIGKIRWSNSTRRCLYPHRM